MRTYTQAVELLGASLLQEDKVTRENADDVVTHDTRTFFTAGVYDVDFDTVIADVMAWLRRWWG